MTDLSAYFRRGKHHLPRDRDSVLMRLRTAAVWGTTVVLVLVGAQHIPDGARQDNAPTVAGSIVVCEHSSQATAPADGCAAR